MRVTDSQLEKAVKLIRKMVDDGNSFTYSKFRVCKLKNIKPKDHWRFQKLDSYLSLRKEFSERDIQNKRFIKEEKCS